MNWNRIGCHFLGHEDAEEFGLVMCVYCGDIAPAWAQPTPAVTLQHQLAAAFAPAGIAMRTLGLTIDEAVAALARAWPPR